MSTLLKIAQSAKEVDDVLCLRHQVYVVEDGKFGGRSTSEARIMDRFDAMPFVANIIAYHDDKAIGTIRIVKQTNAGLPTEEFLDFTSYKAVIEKDFEKPVFASAGMLAITQEGRKRRDVIMALFKMATGVCMDWGVTHVVANANHETTSIYEHLGFESIGGKTWIPLINNSIVPMATPLAKPIDWAFSGLMDNQLDTFWLENFSGAFERILLSPNEVLFDQGDAANSVYIVDEGWVSIVKEDDEGQELNLAKLSKGALFGELAMIDESTRSAKAVASTHTDVIRINKVDFQNTIRKDGQSSDKLLKIFAKRLRSTDELVMVMAYAPQTSRVNFALNKLRLSAVPHKKYPDILVSKNGPAEVAKVAGVREYEVRRILELEKQKGHLEYSERWVHFIIDEPQSNIA
ncbi:MAG TPA: cyclic nucleotide-binding domain-containing protein [Gammaproteobacteria bacterium]|nr:cyclic nucleotide-binding domain-containing protein [Gammaproteobacteria bacterium]